MNVVILNDTRPDLHHGCSRVMRILEAGLAAEGLRVTATSPVRHDWARDEGFLRAMAEARLVVINGEGTLHHGTPAGERLLSVVDHPAAAGRPVVLVNALWQDNPDGWRGFVDRMAGAWVRDRRSERQLARLVGREVPVVPDLTLAEAIPPGTGGGIVVGDSVRREDAALLAALALERALPLVPSLSALKRPKGRTVLTRWLRRRYVEAHERRVRRRAPTLALAPDEAGYARVMADADLAVTGRFHGVCYAIAAGTPFLAVASNSWKIEALIEDAGLDPARLMPPERLGTALDRGAAGWSWSPAEEAARQAFLGQARDGAAGMFAALGRLARS